MGIRPMTGSPSVPSCCIMGVIVAAFRARGALSFLGGKYIYKYLILFIYFIYLYNIICKNICLYINIYIFKENRCFGKYSRTLHASEPYSAVLTAMIYRVLALKWM